jgi:hypothetical protein
VGVVVGLEPKASFGTFYGTKGRLRPPPFADRHPLKNPAGIRTCTLRAFQRNTSLASWAGLLPYLPLKNHE